MAAASGMVLAPRRSSALAPVMKFWLLVLAALALVHEASAAAEAYKVAWMWGDSGFPLGHRTSRNNRARWSKQYRGQTPEEAITDLESYLKKEKDARRKVDIIVRTPDGAIEMDVVRNNVQEAINAIDKWKTPDGADKEIARIAEQSKKECFAVRWSYGDGVFDRLKLNWGAWKTAGEAIDELKFDWATHRAVAYETKTEWDGKDFITDTEYTSKNIAEAKPLIEALIVKEKPFPLDQFEASPETDIWKYIQTNMTQDDQLKDAALKKGAKKEETDSCLGFLKAHLETKMQEAADARDFPLAGELKKKVEEFESTKIAALRKEIDGFDKNDEKLLKKAETLQKKIDALDKVRSEKETKCLQGLVFIKTQGPMMRWQFPKDYGGGSLQEQGISKGKDKANVKQSHMAKVGNWSEWKSPQEIIFHMDAAIDLEREKKAIRPVHYYVKRLTGDKVYYDEKAQFFDAENLDTAVKGMEQWIREKAGEPCMPIGADDGDQNELKVEEEEKEEL